MIKILKETFAILNRNLWLLFLFMTISYIGLIYFMVLKSSAETMVQITIGLITLLFIAVAGVAGFFHSAAETIDAEVSTEEVRRFELLKTFPKGVGEYFFSSLGIIVLYLVITSAVFGLALTVGKEIIGLFSFTPDEFAKAMGSVEALAEFQKNISEEDLIKLSKWHLLYLTLSSVLTFLLIYWLPETFYKTKNSLVALFRALKKVFTRPLITLQLFITIAVINVITSIIMAFMMPFAGLMFLVYFVYFYGLLYILLLTLNFYRAKFIEVELPTVESETAEEAAEPETVEKNETVEEDSENDGNIEE